MFNDVRFAVRLLTRNPVLTLVAALSLCHGIGANPSLFRFLYEVAPGPLPLGTRRSCSRCSLPTSATGSRPSRFHADIASELRLSRENEVLALPFLPSASLARYAFPMRAATLHGRASPAPQPQRKAQRIIGSQRYKNA